jgi:hypothetical protein
MSDDKSKVTDKASEIARNIWLAGVGAYGRAVEEAQGRLEKAMEPPKLFRDLVKAGTALEEEARESTIAARHSVEERINRVRENFHNQRPARIEDLIALQKKVEQLSRKVDSLRKALAAQQAGTSSHTIHRKKSVKKPATGSSPEGTRAKKHRVAAGATKAARTGKKKSGGTPKRLVASNRKS